MISFKGASGRFSCRFREVYQQSIEYIGKFFIYMSEGDFNFLAIFLLKVVYFGRNFMAHCRELPEDQ